MGAYDKDLLKDHRTERHEDEEPKVLSEADRNKIIAALKRNA